MTMTSPTDITDRRRSAKRAKQGAERKRIIAKNGTTQAPIKLQYPTPNESK
jgi:hypothetical protein